MTEESFFFHLLLNRVLLNLISLISHNIPVINTWSHVFLLVAPQTLLHKNNLWDRQLTAHVRLKEFWNDEQKMQLQCIFSNEIVNNANVSIGEPLLILRSYFILSHPAAICPTRGLAVQLVLVDLIQYMYASNVDIFFPMNKYFHCICANTLYFN